VHDVLIWGALLGAGLVAGWINTLAGTGSVIAIPALIFWGLPAGIANATLRVAIVVQCATGLIAYRRSGLAIQRSDLRVVLPTLVGAGAGAFAASRLPNAIFEPLLIGTLAVMAVALLWDPRALAPGPDERPRTPHLVGILALIGAGFYGGMLQAGVGLVLLVVLSGLLRYDLVRGNALKLVITLAVNVVTLGVFLAADQVRWAPGAVMAIGNMVGAWLAVRFAVKRGQDQVKKVVVAVVLLSCTWLLVRALRGHAEDGGRQGDHRQGDEQGQHDPHAPMLTR